MESIILGEDKCSVSKVAEAITKATSYSLFLTQWTSLARRFNIPDIEIDKLHRDYTRLDSVITGEDLINRLLSTWKTRDGSGATVGRLCKALNDIKFKEIAERLENDITRLLKETFLQEGLIDFQGEVKTIKEILQESELQDAQSLSRHVTNEILELSSKLQPVKIVRELEPPVPYYVPRFLSLQNRLHREIFVHRQVSDVFVFTGLELYQLSEVASGSPTDISSNQTRRVTVRFILLECENDFDLICKRAKGSVHLIHCKDEGIYRWVKSQGSLALIRKYIQEEERIILSEDEFGNDFLQVFHNAPVCIADTPGMGKSLLQKHIAHQVKQKYSDRVILIFVLREIAWEQVEDETDAGALERIAKQAACNELGAALLQRLISSGHPFELFFDGFDELLPGQVTHAKKLFKSLLGMKNVRVHVTTRPHMRAELEDTLGVIAHHIIPFDDQTQIHFLKNFWISKSDAKDTPFLEEFVKTCLDKLKVSMSDFEQEIAGIPLQITLLGEVYAEDAVRCSNGTLKFGPTINISSIFDMYQQLISIKFKKLESLLQTDSSNLTSFSLSGDGLREKIMAQHVHAAISLIFPEWIERLTCIQCGNGFQQPFELYAVGIIEQVPFNGTKRFVHRTFAEYLIAHHLVQQINMDCVECRSLLLEMVLGECNRVEEEILRYLYERTLSSFRFHYSTVAYFVDSHLKEIELNEVVMVNQVLPNELNVEQTLCACCASEFIECFQFIVNISLENRETSPIIITNWIEMILVTTKHSSANTILIHQLLQFLEKVEGKTLNDLDFSKVSQDRFLLTPLHVAVHQGSYMMAEYFLNLYKGNIQNVQCLLHTCVYQSDQDKLGVLNRKEQIIKLISRANKASLDETWAEDQSTPILMANAHPSLIDCLVRQGANINAVDENNRTVLHTVLLHKSRKQLITPSKYTEIVNLLKSYRFQRWNDKDHHGMTTLARAVAAIELEDQVLQHYSSHGADFNSYDKAGCTLLFHATMGGRSANFIKKLLEYGCERWHWSEDAHTTLVHQAAVVFGNFDVFRYLVEEKISNVNATGDRNQTTLHFAVERRSLKQEYEKIIEFLIEKGAHLEERNSEGNIPLIHAFKLFHGVGLKTIQKMEEMGLKLENYSSDALAAMILNKNLMAPKPEFLDLFECFIQKGARLGEHADFKNAREVIGQHIQVLSDKTEVSIEFLEKLEKITKTSITDMNFTSTLLYNHVMEQSIPLEAVILALLQTRQYVVVQTIRNAFRKKNSKFKCATSGLSDFMESNDQIVLIKSKGLQISCERIIETVDETITHHDQLKYEFEPGTTYVEVNDPATLEYLKELEKHRLCRFIVITDRIAKEAEGKYKILLDKIKWEDLTWNYQEHLLSKPWKGFRLSRQAKVQLMKYETCVISAIRNPEISSFNLGEEVARAKNSSGLDMYDEMSMDIGEDLPSNKNPADLVGDKMFYVALALLTCEDKTYQKKFIPELFSYENVEFDYQIETFKFRRDILVFFVDWLFVFGEKLELEYDGEWVGNFLECCLYSNAHNLIRTVLEDGPGTLEKLLPSTERRGIVHLAVSHSLDFTPVVIEDRKKILSALVSSKKADLNGKVGEENLTPLLMPYIHVELIKHLVHLGADLKATEGQRQDSFAHLASRYLPVDQFHELVSFLSDKNILRDIFSARNYHQCTPLQLAVGVLQIYPDTLGLLHSAGVDFNAVDNDGDNVLFEAICSKRSVQLIDDLIQRGADWKIRNRNGSNALHVAAEYATRDMVSYFVKLGCDVNAKDSTGRTPLDILHLRGYADKSAQLLSRSNQNETKRCVIS